MTTPKLDRTAIFHIAEAASLSLTDAEADTLALDLEKILSYVAELEAVDTSSIQASDLDPRAPEAWRADEVVTGLSHDDALRNAPRAADGGFAVPAFVES